MGNGLYENSPATSDAEGLVSGTMLQLQEDIDRGWRYFWKKRGFDPPPDLYGENNWFAMKNRRDEANKNKASKRQKKARVGRVQEIRE